eukprot:g1693.t1
MSKNGKEEERSVGRLERELNKEKRERKREAAIYEAKIKQLETELKATQEEHDSLLDEWDDLLANADKGSPVRPPSDTSRVRKLPKAADVGTSDTAVPAVLTRERDPTFDRQKYKYDGSRGAKPQVSEIKKRLIAPMAGFLSAGLEISIVWPSEYAKTQLQLNRGNREFRVFSHMYKEGFGIYRGLTPLLIGAPIQGLLRFGSLDFFNNLLRDPDTGKVGRASGLLAGISAGVMESIVVVTPMETVKTRLVDSGKGIVDGVRYVVAKHGIGGLYKGLFPTMSKSCSNQALRFLIFGEYKRLIIGQRPTHELTAGEALVGGMTAGCLGAIGNTPFDTVKTRMQGLEAGRYSSMLNCATTMVRTEGVFSLWKGLLARCSRVVPGQGIIFCSYEAINNWLTKSIL